MKMMINNVNNNQSGYRSLNRHVNMALSGEHARNVNHPSGGNGAREAALTRRIRQLEQRVFALEETLHQADQLRKKTAEEALVAKYGESVDKSLAARIMGVTRSTVRDDCGWARGIGRRGQARERAQHCAVSFIKNGIAKERIR